MAPSSTPPPRGLKNPPVVAKAKAPDPPATLLEKVATVAFIALLVIRQASVLHLEAPQLTTPEDAKLYEQVNDVLDPAVLDALGRAALAHPDLRIGTPAFASDRTRGLTLRFNRQGASQLGEATGSYHFLKPFFDAAADSESNAFSLSVLVDTPAPDSDADAFAMSLHACDSVGIDSARQYVAHRVSVFTAQMPPSVTFGTTLIFFDPAIKRRTPLLYADKEPAAQIAPVQGSLIRIRGDALFALGAVHSLPARTESAPSGDAPAGRRVTLVLEEFQLDSTAYKSTVEFDASGKDLRAKSGFVLRAARMVKEHSNSLLVVMFAFYCLKIGIDRIIAMRTPAKQD